MHKIWFSAGALPQTSLWELIALPRPLSCNLKTILLRGWIGKGVGEDKTEGRGMECVRVGLPDCSSLLFAVVIPLPHEDDCDVDVTEAPTSPRIMFYSNQSFNQDTQSASVVVGIETRSVALRCIFAGRSPILTLLLLLAMMRKSLTCVCDKLRVIMWNTFIYIQLLPAGDLTDR